MTKKPLLVLYSFTHFWVDLSCAFLVFRTLSSSTDFALCLLLYNFCAFAMQMPLGLLADHFNRNGVVAALGCSLVALAYVTPGALLTAVVAGLGNALFHLGGGIDTLNVSETKAAALGIFVSPGAFGLYLGTIWSKGTSLPLWIAPLVLILLAVGILWLCRHNFGSLRSRNAPLDFSGNFKPILPLFLVVVLRSYMGMNQSFQWKSGGWAIALVAALVLGKATGGFLMDFTSPRKASVLSLGAAAILYLFSAFPLPGTLAVFFFNMTMPVTLWAVARVIPGAKGFTFGTLTFALFLGFLPSWLGWPSLLTMSWSYAVVSLVSLALLLIAFGKERNQ